MLKLLPIQKRKTIFSQQKNNQGQNLYSVLFFVSVENLFVFFVEIDKIKEYKMN